MHFFFKDVKRICKKRMLYSGIGAEPAIDGPHDAGDEASGILINGSIAAVDQRHLCSGPGQNFRQISAQDTACTGDNGYFA